MNQEKIISAIIPCYNCESYIEETVNSLLLGTSKLEEIILINDSSEDNSLNIMKKVEKYNKHIVKVIDLEENKGVSYCRNYGAKLAKGQYIVFMDSDDIAEKDLIEKSLKRIEEINSLYNTDKFKLCYSSYYQINEDGKQISEAVKGIQFPLNEALGYMIMRNYISTSGVVVEKQLLLELGGFNEDIKTSEDWDLWLRISEDYGLAYVDKPLVKIRRHTGNTTSNVYNSLKAEKSILKKYAISFIKKAIYSRKLEDDINIVDFVSILFKLDYLEEAYDELQKVLKKGSNYYNLYFYLGLYYLYKNQLNNALESFEKTIEIKYNHGAALNNIGVIYSQTGKKERATEYFKEALSMFPNYMDACYNLSMLKEGETKVSEIKVTTRELRNILLNYSK